MMHSRRVKDQLIRHTCGLAAVSVPLLLLLVLGIVVVNAWPSIRYNGWHFFTTITWNEGNLYSNAMTTHGGYTAPHGAQYGMLVFLVGTLLTSFIALAIAVPISVGVALFITEVAHARLSTIFGTIVELLAGVPSVVFGLWGFEVVAPAVRTAIGPALRDVLGFIPFFGGSIGTGVGLLSASIVLAIMVIPIVTSVTRDLLRNVPWELREQGLAMGTTRWELVRTVLIPYARSGIVGGIALGFGRALGETMAVLMVSGSAVNYLPHNIYSPVGTMAANIVALLDGAMTDPTGMAVHALAELALVLFVITFAVNALVPIIARGMVGISSTLPTAALSLPAEAPGLVVEE